MKIAIEGCAHGELDKIYECILTLQEREGISVDLLICCGDFQSTRNKNDLRAMAVPLKYQSMCTFYKYYSGEKKAPILTIFIGGNHEASNYLQELPYGGWVAPNIYYLGRAGVVQFGNLKIGGLSGIFKGRDYLQGLWESPPYNQNSLRSVYHIRSIDVFRLSQLKEKVHVMLSHDWPRGIAAFGNKDQLMKFKPCLREDIESNHLGSAPAEKLLNELKPDYWFAAHLHCQFAALVEHKTGDTVSETKFLALDKCLPKRRHLQILDLPPEYDGEKCLKYDAEWLAVLKSTNHLLSVKNVDTHLPGPGGNERYDFTPTEAEKEAVTTLLGDMVIKHDSFVRTAPVYNPNAPQGNLQDPVVNPQTVKLCELLGIDDPLQVVMARSGRVMREPNFEQPASPIESIKPSEVITPMKNCKLFLPAPVTSSVDKDSSVDTTMQTDTLLEDTTLVTDGDDSLIETQTSVTEDNLTDVKEVTEENGSPNVTQETDTEVTDVTESNGNDSLVQTETSISESKQTDETTEATPDNSLVETPTKVPEKKTFKRRNQALYINEEDESTSKLPCKPNEGESGNHE